VDNFAAHWAPRPALITVGWVLAVGAAAGCVANLGSGDRAGELLLGIAALALLTLSAYGTFVRPRLAADGEGVEVRTAGGRRRLAWSGMRVRLRTTKRLGRESSTVELETDDQLLVFGWLELGTDPRDVFDVLSALRTERL
jgi:hypothetical protein